MIETIIIATTGALVALADKGDLYRATPDGSQARRARAVRGEVGEVL